MIRLLVSVVSGAGTRAAFVPWLRSVPASVALAQHQSRATPSEQDNAADRMRRRFLHPARSGDLIGLRVLDDNDVTIGIVREAARTP
jgi:hypothetical protein